MRSCMRSVLPMAAVFVFILSFGLAGCAEVRVQGQMLRPAEINMAGYQQVTIEPIQGQGGDVITERLKQSLAEANFEVLDRESLGQRQREETLEKLGQAAPGGSGQKITKAGVLIKGKVLKHNFTQQVHQGTTRTNAGTYVSYCTEGQANVEVSLQVVDLASMKIIAPKSVQARETGRTDYFPSPPPMDSTELFDRAHASVVADFMRAIAPYKEYFEVTLYKVGSVPTNDAGIEYFKSGNYADAAREFESALATAKSQPKVEPKDVSRITSNVAMAHEFSGDSERAIAIYKEAVRLDPGNGAYAQSISRCERRIRDVRKLKDQGVPTAAAGAVSAVGGRGE